MIEQAPILIVVTPLLAALFITIIGLYRPLYSWALTIVTFLITSIFSFITLKKVIETGTIRYMLGNWPAPFGIEYVIDHLNALIVFMIAVVGLIVAIYSKHDVKKELGDKIPHFYSLFTLLVTGLLGITLTGDAFNLYVLLEISALTSYALLALSKGRAYIATYNYLIMGTIGACFYLLGVGYLLINTGSLNMTDIFVILSNNPTSYAVLVAFLFIMIGMWIKMALFPLHSWLPNAYTYAPTSTSCLLAPLMTKVSVYVMLRMMTSVFNYNYIFNVLGWQTIIVSLAVIAIVAGSIFALRQDNLKKMLTYLIVAEIGYMVGGAWLGNANGFTGASYHIIADGFMTLCLFLAVGCIIYKIGDAQISSMKGIFTKMPITMIGFLVGAFSMIGVPPTCGFFSKWYLISGAYEAQAWPFMVALLISSLVNAILFFRIIEVGYFQAMPNEDPEAHPKQQKYNEAPISMLIPLLTTAAILIGIGLYTSEIVTYLIEPFMDNFL
jgi:multicomponent Na+:H+ antiporter subunit D